MTVDRISDAKSKGKTSKRTVRHDNFLWNRIHELLNSRFVIVIAIVNPRFRGNQLIHRSLNQNKIDRQRVKIKRVRQKTVRGLRRMVFEVEKWRYMYVWGRGWIRIGLNSLMLIVFCQQGNRTCTNVVTLSLRSLRQTLPVLPAT